MLINGVEHEIAPSANLRYADLSDADLSDADLSRADLSDADLSGADLSGADLSGADLSGADLSSTNLRSTNLRGANLSSTNLRGANLSGAYLNGAGLGKTCLVDGGQRSDGYRFVGLVDDGVLQIYAGCRSLSVTKAWAHWTETRGGTPLGEETFAILTHIVAVAKIRKLIGEG